MLNIKKLLTKMLQWIKSPYISNSVSGVNTFYEAERTDTGVKVAFGVGAGGTNHGVWSDKLNKWMIYADASNVYIDGRVMSPIAYGATLPSTFSASTFLIQKYGAVVTITVNNVSKAGVGNNVLLTLPAGWRPPAVSMTPLASPAGSMASGAQNLSLRLSVQSNGEVSVYNYRSSAITGNTNAGGVLTYIATQ